MIRYILLIALFIAIPWHLKAQQLDDNRIFAPSDMQKDFNYLRERLENTHPGLYMHETKEVMQYKMDSLYSLLKVPLSFYQFYGIITQLIADVKCEHTSCSPYKNDEFQSRIQQYKLLPFNLYFSQHKAYVLVNMTKDTSIHLGDEVCFINHQPVDSLERILLKYIPSDGDMETSKERLLSGGMAFNVWYYLFINHPESFDIKFKSLDGTIKERKLGNISSFKESNRNALNNLANKRIIAISKKGKRDAANPWRLELLKERKAAILTIRTFSGDKKAMFEKFEKFFNRIKTDKIANLIIDLGDNGGGDEAAAAELFSYLILKPTYFITDEYLITDKDSYLKQADLPADMLDNKMKYIKKEQNGKFFVQQETQAELKPCDPRSDRYTGKIYLYVNGGTCSAASTFAALVQSNHLGTIVGQETGGSYFGGGSSVGLNLTLPNSGIIAHTSIVYCDFAVSGNHDKNRGVIPAYYFVPAFSELVHGNTSWKDYIFELIEKN
ncbi:MAG: peptidase family [Mucilaginibacter sp.]|nr:peptidase family [Mucilaginibacter sp.]